MIINLQAGILSSFTMNKWKMNKFLYDSKVPSLLQLVWTRTYSWINVGRSHSSWVLQKYKRKGKRNMIIILQTSLLSTFAINWRKQRATPYSKLRSSWCAPPAVIIGENHLIYIHSTKFTHKIWQTKNSSKQQKTHYNTMIIAITMLTKTLPI